MKEQLLRLWGKAPEPLKWIVAGIGCIQVGALVTQLPVIWVLSVGFFLAGAICIFTGIAKAIIASEAL